MGNMKGWDIMEKKNFISIELFLQEDSTLLHLKFLVNAVYFAC